MLNVRYVVHESDSWIAIADTYISPYGESCGVGCPCANNDYLDLDYTGVVRSQSIHSIAMHELETVRIKYYSLCHTFNDANIVTRSQFDKMITSLRATAEQIRLASPNSPLISRDIIKML